MDISLSPGMRQLLMAGSPIFAALSVGGAVSYPSVILYQFKANDSSIQLDLDTGSWVGSIHGLAGIPSILMPMIMQWRGRKFAFIITCALITIGWFLTYTAKDVASILVAESFHGLGSNSLVFVSYSSVSEMVAPKFRNASMLSYSVVQTLGMALVNIIGRYLHWKTVSLVMNTPIIIALLIGCICPESPPWLAYKGKLKQCRRAFVWLRGTDETSNKELNDLIAAQTDALLSDKNTKKERVSLKSFWKKVTKRDFYLPSLHMFVIQEMIFGSGMIVVMIYASQMIEKATSNEDAAFVGGIIISTIFFLCNSTSIVTTKYFNNKFLLLLCASGISVCLLCASVVSYLQTIGTLPKDSLICFYCLIVYMIIGSSGLLSIGFSTSALVMPVKHRGLGGTLYTIIMCVLHASSLKIAPYLFLYIDLWGTFLLYMINAIVCALFVWKYVPETKTRTLQEIEDYYVYGHFKKRVLEADSACNPIIDVVNL